MIQSGSDAAGAVAVGGNLTIPSAFTVNNNGGLTEYALVVQQNINQSMYSLILARKTHEEKGKYTHIYCSRNKPHFYTG